MVTAARDRKALAPSPDPRLTALVPYAKGEKPVIFRAENRTEILDALKIAADLKLRAVISGGAEAWKVAEALKAAKVPVLVGGTLRLPTEATDPYDAAYANPARLHEAGVSFALKSGGSDVGTASRNLPYDAAMAVAFGLPEAAALRAVTLAPAEILGVADQLGSLEVGKRANLVLTAGHILQPTTEVKGLFLAGKPLPPESRHTRLYAKYKGRLAEVKAGTAPLGIDTDPGSTTTPPANTTWRRRFWMPGLIAFSKVSSELACTIRPSPGRWRRPARSMAPLVSDGLEEGDRSRGGLGPEAASASHALEAAPERLGRGVQPAGFSVEPSPADPVETHRVAARPISWATGRSG